MHIKSMVSFDDNQLVAEVQTMTLILYSIRKNAIELVSLLRHRKKQLQRLQPTFNFYFIWCKKNTCKIHVARTYAIYLPFNFLQLFHAFAVKVNSMGLLTEFFMIHNFSLFLLIHDSFGSPFMTYSLDFFLF